MNRLAIFANPRDVATRVLLPALLEAAADRDDLRAVTLLVPEDQAAKRPVWRHWRERVARSAQVALGSGRRERAIRLPALDLPGLARCHGLAVRVLPDGDPNHPEAIAYLRREARADLALSIYCLARFREALLGGFDMSVNYHNGHLPTFRGLRASNWSLYMDAPTSGYAFHRMEAGIDTGNLLCAGEVAVDPDETPADLELRKASAARSRIPELLDALVRREAGRPQRGVGCLYNRQAHLLATRMADPSSLSWREWERRLRAFQRVHARLDGRWWPVTGLAPASGPGRLCFLSADGRWLRLTGADFWPPWLRRCWPLEA